MTKLNSSFEIYHPENTNHNQDGNHMTIKYGLYIFFFEMTENDGKNFLAGIVGTASTGEHRSNQNVFMCVQLVAKKPGTVRIILTHFYHFFSVKTVYAK
jgi:hypothetical protein